MNIALTYTCNQECAYCFGHDAMDEYQGRPSRNFLSMENLDKVLSFLEKSSVYELQMIGGEPTLHPDFKGIYKRVTERGFRVMIFSNGVIKKEIVDFLKAQDNLTSVLLNIREPKEYSISDWNKILYTLSQLGERVILSFRIYRLGFNPTFLFDLIERYHLRKLINWAMACPSLLHDNVFLPLEDHIKAVDRMIEFSVQSQSRGIDWYSDSGFIWCAFTDGRSQILKERVGFIPDTNCYPALEVAPDLRVMRCFGLASKCRKDLKLTDFDNLKEVELYFFKKSLPFKRIGAMDKCFHCEHLLSNKCGGGCMAHILRRMPNYRKLPIIF